MNELTKEFERIIEDTSGGTHNSQDWWDMDLCGTETIIDGLCRRLERAALNAKPRLPRVSPEGLVEGEWYVVRKSERDKPDWDQIMEATEAPGWDGADLWFVDGDDYLMPKDCFAIWGPIPEYELEGV